MIEALKPSQYPTSHIHSSTEKLMQVNVIMRNGTLRVVEGSGAKGFAPEKAPALGVRGDIM